MKRPDSVKKQISKSLTDILSSSDAVLTGLTGGIATGKSTAAEIFRELGDIIIDFDILARSVVEPEKVSWKLIKDFFGGNILNPDKTINRKKLSAIVFNDTAKREKLESFTHPYIWDEFIELVKAAVEEDKKAIIHAVIPLLIEGNMQDIFSKIIVVYLPPDEQLKRLMNRDGISRQTADKILKSQMPINEKLSFSDYIINNDKTVEHTRAEVKKVWESIRNYQDRQFIRKLNKPAADF